MIQGVHFVRSRKPGKPTRWYVYAWRGGPLIAKSEGPTKPRLTAADLAALSAALEERSKPDLTKLEGLIRELRIIGGGAREWKALAPSTRRTWSTHLNRIEEKWGETPLNLWNNPRMVPKIVAWRDSMADKPRAADLGVQVLGFLLEFGRLRGRVTTNVATGIPTLYRPAGREEIIWTAEDLDRFALAAITLNRPHLIDAVWLACLTGLRKADLVGLKWSEVFEHNISLTARKKSRGRRRRASIPMYPALRQLLDELRLRERAQGVDNVLVNSFGRPWGDLTSAVCQVRDLAGIAEPANEDLGLPERPKHLHDCRGTFVTHLCLQRLTDQEIANIVAWSPENVASIRRRYVDDAAVVIELGKRMSAGQKNAPANRGIV